MFEEQKNKFLENLLNQNNFKGTISNRKNPYISESIQPELVEKYKSEGWGVDKIFKTRVRVKKLKNFDLAFEDLVWTTISSLGFDYLNRDRKFKLPYSDDLKLTQQIDVFAADNETILIIECKATDGEFKKGNFKESIEAIGGKKEGILKALKKIFPESKHKVKFIFATKNYYLSDPDQERLKNFGIIHFNEEIIKYYYELSKHLGISAKYQLLGSLFEGTIIPGLDNKIPAIQGKMGGHTYFSFSIEPEKLLKISYVLHRNKANIKLMPTYQRLIKKTRLQAVQKFIDGGGFFPNSIIINLNPKKVRFEAASPQIENSISKIGILHLSQSYRSAYIIDGQHRLFGYSNSEFKNKNSIPVVAFVDLSRWEQVHLFMQINENQKAVPRSLKNDLDADLLWESKDPKERIKALKLFIAKSLGEENSSPLYDRILLGENPKTDKRCITTEAIKLGLDRSNFFPAYTNKGITQDGTFFRGDNENTLKVLLPFLIGSFNHIKNNLLEVWQKGEDSDGYLSINAGVESLLRIFSDIIDHLLKIKAINPKSDKVENILSETIYYLDPLISFLKDLSVDQKLELRKSYGAGKRAKYYRTLQKAINDARPTFNPDGLEGYWKNEAKKFNTQSIEMIRDIEIHFKEDFKQKLENYYGATWFKKGIPPQVQESSTLMALHKNREIEDPNAEKEPWDCLNMIDYRRIAIYGSNWRDIFETEYTEPNRGKKSGNKEDKTTWMQKLEKIRNQNFHEYSVKEDEYEFLNEIHNWLVKSNVALEN